MKKIIFGCGMMAALIACGPGNGREANHFSMVVDGTYLQADTNATVYFMTVADSGLGLFGNGGTIILSNIQLYHIGGTGTYPIISSGFSDGGLRFQQTGNIVYYINETHGNGSLTLQEYNVEPGTIHRLKGTFEGTAATDSGQTVVITEGSFSYTEP